MMPSPSLDHPPCRRDPWKHGAVPVVGLIGGIGAGKSVAARMLAERGATVIDADAVGHELLTDPGIRARIIGRFGPGVLEAQDGAHGHDPAISRRALGAIVFADPASLRDLEAILHPAMRERFRREIDRVAGEDRSGLVVLDAAVLLEAGWDDLCDLVVYVDAPRDERLRRVAAARGWTASMLEARERSQWAAERKRCRADWILCNDGDLDRLGRELDGLVDRLRSTDAPVEPEPRSLRHEAAPHDAAPALRPTATRTF